MSRSQDKGIARKRASVMLSVRSGRLTAEEGARQLGVSRKTYYEWENRALAAMTEAMEDKPCGRPRMVHDRDKQQLQEKVAELERKLFIAEKTVEVRDLLHEYELLNANTKKSTGESLKKKRQRKKKL